MEINIITNLHDSAVVFQNTAAHDGLLLAANFAESKSSS